MEINNVTGSFPEKFEYLRGGVFVNMFPNKIGEEGDNYEYWQAFTSDTRQEHLDKVALEIELFVKQLYLDKTDHKFFNGYKPKDDEDLVLIETTRDEYREFIRANKD